MNSHFTRESIVMMLVAVILLTACGQATLADGDVLPMAVTSAQMVKDWAIQKGGEFVMFGPNGLQLYWRPLQSGAAWVVDRGGAVIGARLSQSVCSGNFCNFPTFNALKESLLQSGWTLAPAAGAWWSAVGHWFFAGARAVVMTAGEAMMLIIVPVAPVQFSPDGGVQ